MITNAIGSSLDYLNNIPQKETNTSQKLLHHFDAFIGDLLHQVAIGCYFYLFVCQDEKLFKISHSQMNSIVEDS